FHPLEPSYYSHGGSFFSLPHDEFSGRSSLVCYSDILVPQTVPEHIFKPSVIDDRLDARHPYRELHLSYAEGATVSVSDYYCKSFSGESFESGENFNCRNIGVWGQTAIDRLTFH